MAVLAHFPSHLNTTRDVETLYTLALDDATKGNTAIDERVVATLINQWMRHAQLSGDIEEVAEKLLVGC